MSGQAWRRYFSAAAGRILHLACVAVAGCSLCEQAHALDLFGLFGSDDPPPVSATTLSYRLEIEAKTPDGKSDSDAEQVLRDASGTYRLRQEPPPDGEGLARRLQADINPLLDALWGLGHYNAEIDVTVDGVPVSLDETGLAAAARRADTFRNRTVVPIKVAARLGPLFKLRTVEVDYSRDQAPHGLPRRAFALRSGDPAISADLRAAQVKLVDWFRSNGHPLAKIADVKATVDHAAAAMDFRLRVEAGPKAGIGAVTISGGDVDPRVVATHVYLREGEPYSPERLALTKTSIAKIPAIGGIRVREADKLDANGNLPVFIDLAERPRHAVGLSAKYSTVDGPGIAGYYEDRNIFGGGDRLRLEASASLLQRIDGTSFTGFNNVRASDFGARFTGTFIKPGLFGTANDLLIEATAFRERVGNNDLGGYTDDTVRGTFGVIHRFSEAASLQAGLQVEQSKSQDVLGRVDATLIGFTATGRYDTTDNPLDPTRGARLSATVNAYPKLMGSTIDLFEARVAGSAYYAIDEQADYVLAGRLAAGSLAGAPLSEIPDAHRFFAGGGGSVRGYGFNTISPMMFGQITGGRSLIEGSAEVRVRITPTIGLVPFFDFGTASRSSLPGFDNYVGYGAGLGLRYLTPVGPIRLDVATPLNPRPGDSRYAIYVSIGQAF
ncbi:autotransporter assembly complex family protein [Bradyrhizobium sp. CCBAU 51753]|uniref:autotransporter assembly complex protein TamA n=1 Tax=Bradyrhizobium sp. CCBAU 51753 TaxID=1325100 RepID=UPI00188B19E5|nr:BamA/TamA family outer membrane protein [Bradyrhizobium sp. CCBAU 51753]QOZ28075.1 outer membrane protein assembly factor [Bradyrhizobium sp. CCBAU 51753]